jgi:3-dehydroquinate synthase
MVSRIDRTVQVALGERSYRIDIGHGLLRDPAVFEGAAPAPTSVAAIVSDDRVAPLYADRVASALAPHVSRVACVTVPAGEAGKTLATFERILGALLAERLDRRSLVVALGGGVIGDLAGFAAGCYQRGIDCIQVPTTLLSQVDSSVGGKTGVNHAAGKNMIGVFHQPRRVVIDLETLATLPARELAAGVAEVIKIGAVADGAFFERIAGGVTGLLARDDAALADAVAGACELKAGIVTADEREEGRRAVLNFGHTFGHAIESAAGYGTWLHGEAVGCGMAMAADLSVRLGLLDGTAADRLRGVVASAGLPIRPPALPSDRWIDLMRGDKKASGGEMRFVLLEGLGRAVVRAVPEEALRDTLHAFGAPRR